MFGVSVSGKSTKKQKNQSNDRSMLEERHRPYPPHGVDVLYSILLQALLQESVINCTTVLRLFFFFFAFPRRNISCSLPVPPTISVPPPILVHFSIKSHSKYRKEEEGARDGTGEGYVLCMHACMRLQEATVGLLSR